jgi:hypothetical protein
MKVNRTVKGLLMVALFISCNKEGDYFFENNKAPSVYVKKIGSMLYEKNITDSMKASFGIVEYNIKIDDEHADMVKVGFQSNFNISEFTTLNDSTFSYKSNVPGEHQLVICVTDAYNLSQNAIVNIIAFENIPPVAKLEYTMQGDEIFLDASGSYDGDEKFGGSIEKYLFYVCGDLYPDTTTGKKTFAVDINQEITLKVRVYDNENAWDETQEIKLGSN